MNEYIEQAKAKKSSESGLANETELKKANEELKKLNDDLKKQLIDQAGAEELLNETYIKIQEFGDYLTKLEDLAQKIRKLLPDKHPEKSSFKNQDLFTFAISSNSILVKLFALMKDKDWQFYHIKPKNCNGKRSTHPKSRLSPDNIRFLQDFYKGYHRDPKRISANMAKVRFKWKELESDFGMFSLFFFISS